MGGLRLPTRVGLIGLVAFFAVWLLVVSASYISNGLARKAVLPPPERLSALAELVERTTAEQRPPIFQAVRTPIFSARLAGRGTAMPDLPPADASVQSRYQSALDGRPVVVVMQEPGGMLQGLFARTLNAVEFRIELSSGETLVVATQSPFIIVRLGLPVGFGAAVLGILIALVTLIVLHREFRPLWRLARTLDSLDPTDETITLPPIRARSPEMRALISAFERLQSRLAILIRARMALVGGIQHDVRTFATRLRLRVDKIPDPEERDRAVTDIAHMIALLDDALLASRAGASELDQELIDFAPLVSAEITDRASTGAPVDLAVDESAEQVTVLGDRLALRRIVENLVDNALKYGQSAKLTLTADAERLALMVDDKGPGIPIDRRQYLLEPFTRLETSRARETGGAGLGLAVVRSLVEAHDGSLEINDAPGGGARLIVRLPVFVPEASPCQR